MSSKIFRRRFLKSYMKNLAKEKIIPLSVLRQLSLPAPGILIVDHDEKTRFSLKRILEREGYLVFTAEDGFALAQLLEERSFDLFIIEEELPWVNGLEICKLLQGDPFFHKKPRIFISKNKNISNYSYNIGLLYHKYLCKPFDSSFLCETVEELVRDSLDILGQSP